MEIWLQLYKELGDYCHSKGYWKYEWEQKYGIKYKVDVNHL